MNNYIICKYRNKWAILDIKTKVYYGIGSGKKACEIRCKLLNKGA